MDSEKENFGNIIKTLSPSSIEDELNKNKRHSQRLPSNTQSTQNFLSKANLRRGLTASITYNAQSSNSPIVNYFSSTNEQKIMRGSGNSNYNFSPSIFNERSSASNSMMAVTSTLDNLVLGRGPNGMVYNLFREKFKEQLNVVDSECEDNENGINIEKQIRENEEEEKEEGKDVDEDGEGEGENKSELSFSMFSDVVDDGGSNVNGSGIGNKGEENMPIQNRMNMNLRKHIFINMKNKGSENGMIEKKEEAGNEDDNKGENNKEDKKEDVNKRDNDNKWEDDSNRNVINDNENTIKNEECIDINDKTNNSMQISNDQHTQINLNQHHNQNETVHNNIIYQHPYPHNNNQYYYQNIPLPFLPYSLPPFPSLPPSLTIPQFFYLLISQLPTFSIHPFPQFNPSPSQSLSASFSNPSKKPKKQKRLDQSTYNNLPITSLLPNFLSLATDQGGCRYLQHLIDSNPSSTISTLYPSFIEHFLQITLDPFGNYLVQKVLPHLSETHLLQIITLITPHIYEIGTNPQGTRVIQQLITCLTSSVLIECFLRTILPYVISFLKDLNGTHVVQKFAKDHPSYSQYIDIIIIKNCASLAMNRHGCCVVQNYFTLYRGELLERFIKKLIESCLMLIIDQFGNYVIQSILLMKNVVYGNEITERIIENVSYYAKHKYSSNVVEKCFEYCDGIVRQKLICGLTKKEVIEELMFDEHGNYIIQKAIACADEETRRIMLRVVVQKFQELKEMPFGERIVNRLSKNYASIIEGIKGEKGGKKGKSNNGSGNKKGSGNKYNNSLGYKNRKEY